MQGEKDKIDCKIFKIQDTIIKDITNKINKIEGAEGKSVFAEVLQCEAGILLSCPEYSKNNIDCKNCHFISKVRKNTANLIIKANKLRK